MLHTDIKPENILVVGISNKINKMMNDFKKIGFDDIYKKKYNECLSNKKKVDKEKIMQETINEVKKMIKKNIMEDLASESENLEETEESNSSYDSDSSEDSDDSEESDDLDIELIDDNYLKYDNVIIKLSDYGNCLPIDETNYKIQTRYYRAPEIILRYDMNERCDVWSIGCTMYELLTGELLFDPDKEKRFNRDRSHIYEIQSKLGLIPKNLIDKSRRRKYFFKCNGLMKGRSNLDYIPISLLITEKLKNRDDISSEDLKDIIDFLEITLEYDPRKRAGIEKCLSHKWLKWCSENNKNNKKKRHKKRRKKNKH